jgi:hypothetical protein
MSKEILTYLEMKKLDLETACKGCVYWKQDAQAYGTVTKNGHCFHGPEWLHAHETSWCGKGAWEVEKKVNPPCGECKHWADTLPFEPRVEISVEFLKKLEPWRVCLKLRDKRLPGFAGCKYWEAREETEDD